MTQDFSRGYLPPGMYIEEDESVVVNATGVPPTIVGLVGQTLGYQVFTEQVPITEDGLTLTQKGIDQTSVSVTTVGAREVVDPADYVVDDTGTGHDTITTFTLADNAETAEGTPVWVTYHYTDPEYFSPKTVTSFEDVKDLYGEPLNLTPGSLLDSAYQHVLSPLSLAAKVAFENGATELVMCAAEPPTGGSASALSTSRRTNLNLAMQSLLTLTSVNVVVPVAVGIATADAPGALTDASVIATTALDEGVPKFVIIGFDPEVATEPDDLLATSGVKNRRVMLAYSGPKSVLMYSSGINSTFAASHAYLAAAYAGRLAAGPVQRGLTKQSVSSFTGLAGTPLSNSLKNQYSKAGVAVAEVDRLGRLTVRHGVTTDMTNVNTREASVVRARDALVTMIRDGFTDSDLIGDAIDEDMVYSVKSVVGGFLEAAQQQEVIVSYSGLAVRQRPTDVTVIEIKFAYRPAYPLNYIAISFSIDTTTGAIEDTTLPAAA